MGKAKRNKQARQEQAFKAQMTELASGSREINIEAAMDAIVTGMAVSSGGRVSKQQILERLKASPRYNRWKIKRVENGSEEAYWIAANPAAMRGQVFPRTMPDGQDGRLAAEEYAMREALKNG